jgi:hypothetical protein
MTMSGIRTQGPTLEFSYIISNIRCVIVFKIVAENLLNEIYDALLALLTSFSIKNVINS